MGAPARPLMAAILLAMLTLAAAAPADVCPRTCRCFSFDGEAAANCSSPAAAIALGERLRVLRLSHYDDHLSVKEGAFRALSGLKELHLDHLGLVKVYPGAFRGLVDLETLDLSHNALSAGDELSRALRDLPSLRRLSLRGNNFGASHGVPPALVSRTIKFVDLGGCKLRELSETMLAGLTHVRHVVLDGNFIRSFNAAAFPKSVVSFDLSHNDIDRISRAELNKLDNVDAIELAENPLHCSCELLKISYDYNMNKPIVCASPKQLMGKDLLKIKKHQVCGKTKKVKREAGNELDDEALSEEDLENEEGIVYDSPEDVEPENTAGTETKSVHEEDDAAEEPEPLNVNPEPKDPLDDNVDDLDEAASAPSPQDEKKSEIPEAEGPEDIDGVDGDQSLKEPENLEDGVDTENVERIDENIHRDSKSELPPDEVKDPDENEPEEISQPEPKLTSTHDELPEPDSTGDAIRTADADAPNTEDEVPADNDDNTSNGDALVAADNENTSGVEDGAAAQDNPVDEEPPDSLPASTYNHVQEVAEKADRVEENEDEIDNGDTKDETPEEELSKVTAVKTEDAPEEEEEEVEDGNEESVGGVGGVLDGLNSKEEANKETNQDVEENISEDKETIHSAVNPDSMLDEDVEEAETHHHSQVGSSVREEGARMESAADVENDDDEEDGDDPVNEDNKDSVNTLNNEDDVLSSIVHPRITESDAIHNEDEGGDSKDANAGDGTGETDTDVENIDDKTNVVQTSGIGARAESDTAGEEEDVDDDEVDDNTGDVGGVNEGDDGDAEIKKEAGIEDDAAGNTSTNEEIDAVETVDGMVENAPEGNEEDDENDDILPGSVVAAAGKNEDAEKEDVNGDGAGAVVTGNNENENVDEPEETLEEELKEDRIHSTLGHADLDGDATSNQNEDDNSPDVNEDPEENTENEDEGPIIPPLIGDNRPEEDDGLGSEDDALEGDQVDGDSQNTHLRHSPTDETENESEPAPKEYGYIEETKEDGTPGGSLSLAPTDTDDNDEGEGSGNVLDGLEEPAVESRNKDDDWTEDGGAESERENEAVPPLDNADSKEITDAVEEHPDEKVTVDIAPSEAPALDMLGGGDNVTEDETGSGAGLGVGVQVEDEEEASNEDDEGSGQPTLFGTPVPTIKDDESDVKEDEEEEGSGKGPFIPVPRGHDTDWDEPVVENESEEDTDDNAATTLAPVVAPEDEIIPRHRDPLFTAPEPPKPHEEPTSVEDDDEGSEEQDITDKGRGFPVEPEGDDEHIKDYDDEFGGFPVPAPTGEAGQTDVVVDADVGEDSKGNIEAGPGADGSEALNKADMWSLNSIGSYVVLGAIMLIVVVLLGYAVCRSRRQKSASARDKDVESAGRELQDVSKPLINNHHPSAPEKQPLDETRQPLMTKEQEASLTIDPEKKPLTDDNADVANHKPKQNGTVPEVVVERQTGLKAATTPPAVNGKASSPASERAPSPAVPAPAPSPTPTPAPAASPAPSPTADAGHANGNAVPLANGGSASPGATTPTHTHTPPAPVAAPVSPGAVRVVAKELPDSVAKRPVIIMNRGADQQQV